MPTLLRLPVQIGRRPRTPHCWYLRPHLHGRRWDSPRWRLRGRRRGWGRCDVELGQQLGQPRRLCVSKDANQSWIISQRETT